MIAEKCEEEIPAEISGEIVGKGKRDLGGRTRGLSAISREVRTVFVRGKMTTLLGAGMKKNRWRKIRVPE